MPTIIFRVIRDNMLINIHFFDPLQDLHFGVKEVRVRIFYKM